MNLKDNRDSGTKQALCQTCPLCPPHTQSELFPFPWAAPVATESSLAGRGTIRTTEHLSLTTTTTTKQTNKKKENK